MSTAFLFPGQGAQTVGMGRDFAASLPAAKDLYDRARQILGYDLAQICFEGPAEKLDSTVYSQPALFVTSLAALESLKQKSPDIVENVQFTAGLSLGEYTALVFAGALRFDDGLRLVAERGAAMQQASDAVPSGMVSIIGLQRDQVEQLCRDAAQSEVIQIANLLGPGTIAVSGAKAACERIVQAATAAGAMKASPLAVAGAFHTPIMQPAVERLSAALKSVQFRTLHIKIVSNVDAQPHDNPEEIRSLLLRQIVSPVLWEDSMRRLVAEGVDRIYEVAPGRGLRSLMKRIDRKVDCQGAE